MVEFNVDTREVITAIIQLQYALKQLSRAKLKVTVPKQRRRTK
jgi:hypothetical protein